MRARSRLLDRAVFSIVRGLTRRRALSIVAFVGFIVASILIAIRMELRLTEGDFLPTGGHSFAEPAADDQADLRVLGVLLQSDEPIRTEDVHRIFELLERRISGLPGVASVQGRVNESERFFIEQFLPQNALLYADPVNLQAVRNRLDTTSARELLQAALNADSLAASPAAMRQQLDPLGLLGVVSREQHRWRLTSSVNVIDGVVGLYDRRTFILRIESDGPWTSIAADREFIAAVREEIARVTHDDSLKSVLDGKRLSLVGGRVALLDTADTLLRDILRVSIAAFVIVLALLALFLRGIVPTLAVLVTVAAALVVTAAIATVSLGSITVFAWIFVGLIVGLGVDFGIHVVQHYLVLARPDQSRSRAAILSTVRPGAALLLGGMTSAAGFASVLATPYPATREAALLTSMGLLLAVAFSLTLLPLLLSFMRPGRIRHRPLFAETLVRVGRGRISAGVVPWTVVLLVAGALLPSTRVELHPWGLVRGDESGFARLDSLSERMGWALAPIAIVSRGTTPEEALDRDRSAVDKLLPVAFLAGIGHVESLAQWLPDAERQAANRGLISDGPIAADRVELSFRSALAVNENVPEARLSYLGGEYRSRVSNLLRPGPDTINTALLRKLGLQSVLDRHVRRIGGGYTVTSFVFLQEYPWVPDVVPRFVKVASEAGVFASPGVVATGAVLRGVNEGGVVRRSLAIAFFVAVVAVTLILLFHFRQPALVSLCLLPALCGVAVALLVLRVVGLEFNLLTVVAAPVLVGIGIDDGIHMVDRLWRRGDSLETAIREAGTSMLLTTVTTIAAASTLVLVSFPGVSELVPVLSAGLAASFLATIHLLPRIHAARAATTGNQEPVTSNQ